MRLQVWHIAHLRELDVKENVELGKDLVVAAQVHTKCYTEQADTRRRFTLY